MEDNQPIDIAVKEFNKIPEAVAYLETTRTGADNVDMHLLRSIAASGIGLQQQLQALNEQIAHINQTATDILNKINDGKTIAQQLRNHNG